MQTYCERRPFKMNQQQIEYVQKLVFYCESIRNKEGFLSTAESNKR